MVCFEGTRVLKDSCVLYEKLKTQRLCLHLGEECRSGQCFCIEKKLNRVPPEYATHKLQMKICI